MIIRVVPLFNFVKVRSQHALFCRLVRIDYLILLLGYHEIPPLFFTRPDAGVRAIVPIIKEVAIHGYVNTVLIFENFWVFLLLGTRLRV